MLVGIGDCARAERIEVTWPGGETQRFDGVAARTSWRLRKGDRALAPDEPPRGSLPDPLNVPAAPFCAAPD